MMTYDIKKHVIGGADKLQQGVSSTAEEVVFTTQYQPFISFIAA
jgi:hypothetical protein